MWGGGGISIYLRGEGKDDLRLSLLGADGELLLALLGSGSLLGVGLDVFRGCGGGIVGGLGCVEAHLAVCGLGDPSKLLDERLAPPGASVLPDVFGKLLVVELALLVAHCDGVVDRVGQLLGIPGVDDQTAVQTLGGTGELGQNHDAVALLLCGNILVGHQVHAVSCRGNETNV